MAGKIKVLDEKVAKLIAAGEVVERPASVVKELVENSLDAGSNRIIIDVMDGGKSRISVADNGVGMLQEDALLALERHSTSKISEADDLFAITTLGFRGEALPSIAAVSKVELITRTSDDKVGTKVTAEAGKILSIEEVAHPGGTTVIVTNLFANFPARLKFLKTSSTEWGHISDIVSRHALAHPEVSFRLSHNGRLALSTSGKGEALTAIADIYGKDLAKELLTLDFEEGDITIKGFVGKSVVTRSNRQHQSIFINGRYVRNELISKALEEAYRNLIATQRYPIAVIYLELDPGEIDVNVHPTKLQVKFRHGRKIYGMIREAVTRSLSSWKLPYELHTIKGEERRKGKITPSVKVPESDISKGKSFQSSLLDFTSIERRAEPRERIEESHPSAPVIKESLERYPSPEVKAQKQVFVLGQLKATYIIAINEAGLLLIDQHAAHERVSYEKLCSQSDSRKSRSSQELLLPLTLELTPREIAILEPKLDILAETGFIIEPFGGRSFIVKSVPVDLKRSSNRQVILDIIDDLLALDQIKQPEILRDEVLKIIACHTSIRAGDKLTISEMKALIDDMFKLDNPSVCIHGRPTMINITLSELNRMFKRR